MGFEYTYNVVYSFFLMDKKQQFYEDLYVAEMQSKPTQEQLASFINQKQSQIAQIL
ncbi:hypothetical protein KA405_02410 [Patescibacteria group bacterium]|nr:hypothetical protein [Patescibacteria group bacterium]